MSNTWLRGRRMAAAVVLLGMPLALPSVAHGGSPVFVAAAPAQLLGSQGRDVALGDTDSAVTVRGTRRFASMSFHLSKTKALTNEAISVSWTGGAAGTIDGPIESTNFMQVMQCWGDPVKAADGTVGPPPEQCVFGADPDALRTNASNNGFQFIRAKMPSVDSWVPFRSVDGTVVKADTGQNPNNPSSSAWINPYYTKYTSNEIGGLRNGPDGSGTAFFEMHTGLQSAGLGCGQKQKNGTIPRCWLVMVPRGPDDQIPGEDGRGAAATTPLDARGPWKTRVAVPLNFTPVASSCALSNAQQSISGADLTLPAMDRWLPRVCTEAGAPPYVYTRTQDDRARTLLTQRAAGGAGDGMIITDTPLSPGTLPAGRIPVYAPVDVSAVVVGFSIQRAAIVDGLPAAVQAAFPAFQSTYVAHLRLTPRLVAKLLTQSYSAYLSPGVALQPTDKARAAYAWSENNPSTMLFDPDFIAANPEFSVLSPTGIESATGLEVSLGSSAAAAAVWRWIKQDRDAMKWLAGEPDPNGMKVNPYYSTTAANNPNHSSFQVPPSGGFPKNDPLTWLTDDAKVAKLPALSLNNEWPYQDSLTSTARVTRSGNRGSRINYDPNSPGAYAPSGSQPLGFRAMLSITDAADAQRFGIQAAALRNANGDFVEPTAAGLTAAVAAMKSDPASGMLRPDSATKVAGAYPMTAVDYAASVSSVLTPKERADYSRLLTFIAGAGQITGEALGQLPRGYLPLPAALRAATRAASSQIAAGLPALPPSTTPHTTTATTVPTTPVAGTTTAPDPPARPAAPPTPATAITPTIPTAVAIVAPAIPTPAFPPTYPPQPPSAEPTTIVAAPPSSPPVAGGPIPPTPRRARTAAHRTAQAPTNEPVLPAASQPAPATSNAASVELAASTAVDPKTTPWVGLLFAVGVLATLAVPITRRLGTRRKRS